MANHLTIEIGQHQHDGRNICDACGRAAMLISAGSCWAVDSEPYKAGEEIEDAPDCVEIDEEVTGHWCQHCSRLISLSLNQRTR